LGYLDSQDRNQNRDKNSNDEPYAQADVADVSDLSEQLVVLILEEYVSRWKKDDFVLFLVELQKELQVDLVEGSHREVLDLL
jgi:hypothetical protein